MHVILPCQEHGPFANLSHLYLTVCPTVTNEFGLQAITGKTVTADDIKALFELLNTQLLKVRLLAFSNVRFTKEASDLLAAEIVKNNVLFMLRFENIRAEFDLVKFGNAIIVNKSIQILQFHNYHLDAAKTASLEDINKYRTAMDEKDLYVEITEDHPGSIPCMEHETKHNINYTTSTDKINIACALVKWREKRYLNQLEAKPALIFSNSFRVRACTAITAAIGVAVVVTSFAPQYYSWSKGPS